MTKLKTTTFLSVTALALLASAGCNLTGGIDKPKNDTERYLDARSKMDGGDCAGALEQLKQIGTPSDESNRLLGWTQLCLGGAPFSKIASTVLSYTSGSGNDFTPVGKLANKLIPSSQATLDAIGAAITAFTNMTAQANSDDRATNLTIAYVVKAAAIIAQASGDGASVKKGDVSVTGCASVADCTTGFATCTVSGSGKMTDPDANAVGTALSAAASAAGANPNLGAAKDLANKLAALTSAAGTIAGAQLNRCTIVNNMLSQ